jgi:hypothetical protein
MKRALLLIKPSLHYRREAFESGFKRLGFTLERTLPDPKPGDCLCTWNLTGGMEREAKRFTRAGASVIVTENGYLTPPGAAGLYAISLGGHNGAGRIPDSDDPARWQQMGLQLKPWRTAGRHILVCGQRGIGSQEMASPHQWHQKAAAKLQTLTRRPIVIRTHPGNRPNSTKPLTADLRDAWAVVIWASSAGVQALVEGIPVFYAAPHWICQTAALPFAALGKYLEQPLCDDAMRQAALTRMAHGQWTYQEIATGEPLRGALACQP